MTENRCTGCEEIMTEIECLECVSVARAASPRNAMKRGSFERRTHCVNGHAYTIENTRIDPQGCQICRTCHRERCVRRRARNAAARAAS